MPAPNLPDPNWLYSTVAQCSAAVFGIIGGFMTATLLQLTSRRGALVAEADERHRRLAALLSQRDQAEYDLEHLKFIQLVGVNAHDIYTSHSVEAKLRSLSHQHIDEEVFAKESERLAERIKRVQEK